MVRYPGGRSPSRGALIEAPMGGPPPVATRFSEEVRARTYEIARITWLLLEPRGLGSCW
jgi:hypothetical protein